MRLHLGKEKEEEEEGVAVCQAVHHSPLKRKKLGLEKSLFVQCHIFRMRWS